MDKLLEALKQLLPEEQTNEVASVVQEMVEEAKKELESEYEANLEEAYKNLSSELEEAERVAYEGYQQAVAIIKDQEMRKETLKEEFEKMLEEQYEEAYKMIESEKGKNTDIETTMLEEYDSKLNDMKEYIVDKVDAFLQHKGKEIYEQAKRDIINDPRMAEHKVVLDKIVELTSDYLSEEEAQLATSSKLEEARQELEKMKAQVKIMEGRNIRISTDNTKMQEQLNEAAQVLREYRETQESDKGKKVISEQKERVGKAANATGRGQVVTDEKLIAEFDEPEVVKEDNQEETTLSEGFGNLAEIKKLAGIK